MHNGNVQQNPLCAASRVTKDLHISPRFSPTFFFFLSRCKFRRLTPLYSSTFSFLRRTLCSKIVCWQYMEVYSIYKMDSENVEQNPKYVLVACRVRNINIIVQILWRCRFFRVFLHHNALHYIAFSSLEISFFPSGWCSKKNLNTSRPSELPPVRGQNVQTFRWGHRLQRQNIFMAFNRVPRW